MVCVSVTCSFLWPECWLPRRSVPRRRPRAPWDSRPLALPRTARCLRGFPTWPRALCVCMEKCGWVRWVGVGQKEQSGWCVGVVGKWMGKDGGAGPWPWSCVGGKRRRRRRSMSWVGVVCECVWVVWEAKEEGGGGLLENSHPHEKTRAGRSRCVVFLPAHTPFVNPHPHPHLLHHTTQTHAHLLLTTQQRPPPPPPPGGKSTNPPTHHDLLPP